MSDYQAQEVQWYLKNGLYPNHRICPDATGRKYVIGDSSWNRPNNPQEWIDKQMKRDLLAMEVKP